MPSFDIVSSTDLAEVDNAINNLMREIGHRYDFKGSKARIERTGNVLVIEAEDEFKLKQMRELLQGHLSRRKIEVGALDYKSPETGAGQAMRQQVVVRQGIDKELARRIVKAIKDAKLKVQVAVQGDELRVSGKKRDDLQAAIRCVKDLGIEQPLQFTNLRD